MAKDECVTRRACGKTGLKHQLNGHGDCTTALMNSESVPVHQLSFATTYLGIRKCETCIVLNCIVVHYLRPGLGLRPDTGRPRARVRRVWLAPEAPTCARTSALSWSLTVVDHSQTSLPSSG